MSDAAKATAAEIEATHDLGGIQREGKRRAIGIKIAVLSRQMRQRFDELVEAEGVTRAKYMLIATVAAHPGATQREIAAKLEVSDVTAGRLIDRMCGDGLLERRENPQDRRAYCVYLTDAVQPLLATLAHAATSFEDEVFAAIDEADLRTLNRLLDKISRNLGTARGDRKLQALTESASAA